MNSLTIKSRIVRAFLFVVAVALLGVGLDWQFGSFTGTYDVIKWLLIPIPAAIITDRQFVRKARQQSA